MQPLIYKERIQRWGFRKSLLTSLIFHGFIIFGISFVVIQQPWEFNKEAIVNIKFANGAFDMQGSSFNGMQSLQQTNQQTAMVTRDSNLQDQSQFSVRRLEANSNLESFETIYLNSWQRQIETKGDNLISESKNIFDGTVQIMATIDVYGNLIDSKILISSGNKLIDDMAINILRESAPFAPFNKTMSNEYSVLEIIRDWNFSNK